MDARHSHRVLEGPDPERAENDGEHAFADGDDGAWQDDNEPPPPDPALAAALAAAEKKHGKAQGASDLAAAGDASKDAQRAQARQGKKPGASVRFGFLLGALALFLYAPMALVSYLRTGSTWALLFVPQGVMTISQDLRAYGRLAAVAVSAFAGAFLLDAITYDWPFYATPLALIPKNVLQLVAWGACGLYVRARARQLGMPVDDEDWTLLTRTPAQPLPPPPPVQARPAAISLDSDDDIPLVQGTVLPPDAPQ